MIIIILEQFEIIIFFSSILNKIVESFKSSKISTATLVNSPPSICDNDDDDDDVMFDVVFISCFNITIMIMISMRITTNNGISKREESCKFKPSLCTMLVLVCKIKTLVASKLPN